MASSATPFNIALIGAGLIGPRHAQSILKLSCNNVNLIALVEPSPKGPALAISLSTTLFTSLPSLLSSSLGVDAAIICTPNATHVPLALQLIEAGIAVLVEKPVSTSISSGQELISKAQAKNVPILVGHHRRFNPYLLAAKKCLDARSLGRVLAVQGTWCLKKPTDYFDGIGEWRRGKNGGVVLINLVHELDLLQYLLGPIVLVSALPTVKERGFEAEEGGVVMMRFESGIVGTFALSDNSPSPWAFEVGTGENPVIPPLESSAGQGFYRIMGSEASLSVPDLTVWRNENWTRQLSGEKLGVDKSKVPFDEQMKHFVRVVREGEKPSCTGEEALNAMVVCEAVKRAMGKGNGMPLEIKGFEIIERDNISKL